MRSIRRATSRARTRSPCSRLGVDGRYPAPVERFVEDTLQVVDIVKEDVRYTTQFGVDVAGDRDIDHQERARHTRRIGGREIGGCDQEVRCRGRGQNDVSVGQRTRDLLHAHGSSVEALGEIDGSVVCAIGDHHALDALASERRDHALGRLTRTENEHATVSQVAEDLARQLDGDRGD